MCGTNAQRRIACLGDILCKGGRGESQEQNYKCADPPRVQSPVIHLVIELTRCAIHAHSMLNLSADLETPQFNLARGFPPVILRSVASRMPHSKTPMQLTA